MMKKRSRCKNVFESHPPKKQKNVHFLVDVTDWKLADTIYTYTSIPT